MAGLLLGKGSLLRFLWWGGIQNVWISPFAWAPTGGGSKTPGLSPWGKQDARLLVWCGGQDTWVPLLVWGDRTSGSFLREAGWLGLCWGGNADAWDPPLGRGEGRWMVGFPFFFGMDAGHLHCPFGTGPDGWVSSSWKAGHLCFTDD